MALATKIEWTDSTWNPWRGCRKVSSGCQNCYMFREQNRFGNDPSVITRAAHSTFHAPLRWKEARFVFTCSWSDFFIEEADPWRNEAWDIIRLTPHLQYQILTKRPENILERLPHDWGTGWNNVWLGVTVENQLTANTRIPHLESVPGLVKFLSCEPLLEEINISNFLLKNFIQWVIVGGESGPKSRTMHPDWVRSIKLQCDENEIPFFFKQWGGTNKKKTGRILDGAEYLAVPG